MYDVEVIERPEQPAVVLRGHADSAHIAEFVGRAFGETAAVVEQEHLSFAGPPFGRYLPTGNGEFDIEAGFPVSGSATPQGNVDIVTLPGGLTAHTMHVGSYEGVGAAYEATATWVAEHGYVTSGPPWETYLDEPSVPNPRTEVFFPVRRA